MISVLAFRMGILYERSDELLLGMEDEIAQVGSP